MFLHQITEFPKDAFLLKSVDNISIIYIEIHIILCFLFIEIYFVLAKTQNKNSVMSHKSVPQDKFNKFWQKEVFEEEQIMNKSMNYFQFK